MCVCNSMSYRCVFHARMVNEWELQNINALQHRVSGKYYSKVAVVVGIRQSQPPTGSTWAHAKTEEETTDATAISLGYATPEAVQFALPCQPTPNLHLLFASSPLHHFGLIELRIAWRSVIWGGSQPR